MQDRKQYKRLYEESLPKKPYPVVDKTISLKHHRVQQTINMRDMQGDPHLMKTIIENRILQKLRLLIWDNVITEKDEYIDVYRYSLDIWMGSEG